MQPTFRVAIVTRSLMMGGAQNHIVKLCQALENVSMFVYLLINDEPRDLIAELPPRINLRISPYKRHDIRTVFWLAKSVREDNVQVVHSFLWHADFYASLLKILIPPIVVLASERGDRGFRAFYKWIYRWVDRLIVFNLADAFCANSQFGAGLLIAGGCNPEKIRVISNGVNLALVDSHPSASLRRTYGWPESSVICCTVSRLVPYKGIDRLIEAVKLCRADIRAVVVGDGPEMENLSRLIKQLELEDRVALVGQFNPAIAYMKAADICVLPTIEDTEHCSNSILEYMACARPVIATNVGGNPELIIPGSTGFLAKPRDAEDMARILDLLSMNEVLAKKMGLTGRHHVEQKYRMESVAEKFLLFWSEFYQRGNTRSGLLKHDKAI